MAAKKKDEVRFVQIACGTYGSSGELDFELYGLTKEGVVYVRATKRTADSNDMDGWQALNMDIVP